MAKPKTRDAVRRYGSSCPIFVGGDMQVHRVTNSETFISPHDVTIADATGACGATQRLVGSQAWRAPLTSVVSGMLCDKGCWS